MSRFPAALIFTVAASSAALAGSGLAVVPHLDVHGAQVPHEHPLAVLRFPVILATTSAPYVADRALATYRYPIYLKRMQNRYATGPRFTAGWSLTAEQTALVLALLAVLVPRLPAPARRAVAEIAPAFGRAAQWRPSLPLAPPRALALRAV